MGPGAVSAINHSGVVLFISLNLHVFQAIMILRPFLSPLCEVKVLLPVYRWVRIHSPLSRENNLRLVFFGDEVESGLPNAGNFKSRRYLELFFAVFRVSAITNCLVTTPPREEGYFGLL